MTKRGQLTKVEKFYIENHAESVTIEKMASILDRSEKVVRNYINTNTNKTPKEKEEESKPEKVKKTKKKKSRMDDLMGHKERNGEKVATTMTQAASEYADQARKNNNKSEKLNSAIHKPRG